MEPSCRTEPATILVVEDEAILRMNAAELLEDSGYEVLEAKDADDALLIMAAHPGIRLVFTDVNMPGSLDGMDLAREVHRRWPDVRLLVTSGRERIGTDEIPDDGRFLPKPYRADALRRTVETLVR